MLLLQPWVGASWEGFVIEQILGLLEQRGRLVDACFLRTSDQHEIDLVLDFGTRLWAIEIKLSASARPGDMDQLQKAALLIKADVVVLISQTRKSIFSRNRASCNLYDFAQRMEGLGR
jgi:hypothetical protein